MGQLRCQQRRGRLKPIRMAISDYLQVGYALSLVMNEVMNEVIDGVIIP